MSLQAPLVDALFAWLDGMAEFEAGRVTKRDIGPLQPDDPGWKAGKPACAVWGAGAVASQAQGGITGQAVLTSGPATALIQVGQPFDGQAATVNAWAALLLAVEDRLLSLGWATQSWFNIEVRFGAQPPAWSKVVTSYWQASYPEYSGLEWWVEVRVQVL